MGHNLKKAVSGDGKHIRAMGMEAAQKGTSVLSSLKLWPAVAKAMAGEAGKRAGLPTWLFPTID
ncbi:hypothetical protein [Chryseolinea serpens]|uniref:hypothetical protein n=1 Tax=Chryseolinea serpens TaxID=947013 RepID=UPI000935240C|nr:hypothetical protein [Chryseolinea serpens]